jgi:hypothetical protein
VELPCRKGTPADSWTADNTGPAAEPWVYTYIFSRTVDSDAKIGGFFLEAPDANASNTTILTFGYNFGTFGLLSPPGGTLVGIGADSLSDTGPITLSFQSSLAPIWGDFYAREGVRAGTTTKGYTYDVGFGPNSTAPPANGSLNHQILIPGQAAVPEPTGPLALLSLGTSGGVVALSRRWRCRNAETT